MFYSARIVAGRKFWIVVLLPLFWPILRAVIMILGGGEKIGPEDAHLMMSLPLSLVAIGLGIRIIAGDIDNRTLEIAYTVPGGCQRVWLAKIATSVFILFAGEVLLAVFTMVFFTSVSPGTFYGVMQASVFYLIAGMAFSAFFRSEITGAMATVVLYGLNLLVQFNVQWRISPFFNPLGMENADNPQVLYYTIQNRIFFIIFIPVLAMLTFSRVERREKMLGD